jgi:hypothetical protein
MNLLHQIYTELYGPLDAPGRKKHLEELAATLSKIANRGVRPWGWHYLNNILSGREGFNASVELTAALQVLAGRIDGRPDLQTRARPMELLVINGQVEAGSVVLGSSKRCVICLTPIIPIVPWQKRCPDCRQKRPKS